MKKLLLASIATMVSLAISYGQGTILINNFQNSGVQGGNGGTVANPVYSSLVTANGLLFTTDPAAQEQNQGGTAGSTLMGEDFSWALYGGATAAEAAADVASGVPLDSKTGGSITGDNAVWGCVSDSSGATFFVPGITACATVYLDLQIWEGNTFSTYAAALAGADYTGTSGVFSNPAGGGICFPSPLVGMPDVLLTGTGNDLFGNVPEPGTLALAALGGASLLMFRRKK
jgi:hypothetical protein